MSYSSKAIVGYFCEKEIYRVNHDTHHSHITHLSVKFMNCFCISGRANTNMKTRRLMASGEADCHGLPCSHTHLMDYSGNCTQRNDLSTKIASPLKTLMQLKWQERYTGTDDWKWVVALAYNRRIKKGLISQLRIKEIDFRQYVVRTWFSCLAGTEIKSATPLQEERQIDNPESPNQWDWFPTTLATGFLD